MTEELLFTSFCCCYFDNVFAPILRSTGIDTIEENGCQIHFTGIHTEHFTGNSIESCPESDFTNTRASSEPRVQCWILQFINRNTYLPCKPDLVLPCITQINQLKLFLSRDKNMEKEHCQSNNLLNFDKEQFCGRSELSPLLRNLIKQQNILNLINTLFTVLRVINKFVLNV